MTNKPKAIGTAAEMAVVKYLETVQGVSAIYRPALQGKLDLGDVHYVRNGLKFVVSVKGGKMAEQASPERVAEWLEEVQGQQRRAYAASAFVVTKRAGVGAARAGLWRAHVAWNGAVWSTDLAAMVRRG